ncbi:MAG: tetratricopeptide repeat protein, partial [Chloroflexi bacterium]|nr:tetratricopeptide repeat protein [Chloroflexota bacterium]
MRMRHTKVRKFVHMAKVALRVYTRDIEELIDHGQIEESIAHSKHILKSLPKLIEAYRLLGKAYLEDKRYGDAADIFQRVLSSKPDDFISNVGMSIIREDEGNLDAALWNMERAFEVQPSNQAIQDELRRLYGRRDGLEPPKIRLTRGALARMYAQGDLFEQAIAELRAALSDDPQRPDLQVLLATMYYQSGKLAEAAETSNAIISKLPYCLEANRLLATLYKDSKREEEAEIFQKVVEVLDPYTARITADMPVPEAVPAQAITVDRLDWHPGQMVEEREKQPAWASSLGVDVEGGDSSGEEIPEWLASPSSAESGGDFGSFLDDGEDQELPPGDSQDSTPEETPNWMADLSSEDAAPISMAAQDSGEEIPDFLQEAGWGEGEGEAEQPGSAFDFESSDEDDEIMPADIPEWLQDMQPEGFDPEIDSNLGKETPPQDSSRAVPDWLQDESAPSEAVSPDSPMQEAPGDMQGAAEIADAPDMRDSDEGTPELVQELGEPTTPAAQAEASPPSTPGDESPEWLQEIAITSDDAPKIAESESIDWLQDLGKEDAAEFPTEDTPEWMNELDMGTPVEESISTTQEPEPSAIPDKDQGDDAMAWLENLATKQDATEEEFITEPVEQSALPPEWEQFPNDKDKQSQSIIDEILSEEEIPAPIANEAAPDLSDGEDAMAWLENLAAKQGAAEEELVTQPGDRSELAPEWVQQTDDEDEQPHPVIDEILSEEEIPAPTGIDDAPDLSNEEDAMGWLESLAAKQGA